MTLLPVEESSCWLTVCVTKAVGEKSQQKNIREETLQSESKLSSVSFCEFLPELT